MARERDDALTDLVRRHSVILTAATTDALIELQRRFYALVTADDPPTHPLMPAVTLESAFRGVLESMRADLGVDRLGAEMLRTFGVAGRQKLR